MLLGFDLFLCSSVIYDVYLTKLVLALANSSRDQELVFEIPVWIRANVLSVVAPHGGENNNLVTFRPLSNVVSKPHYIRSQAAAIYKHEKWLTLVEKSMEQPT